MLKGHPKTIDRQLIDQCVAGNRYAAERFVRTYSDLIYRSIQQILRSKNVRFVTQDLEDFHHDVFLKLFENRCRKLSQYQGRNGCSLKTWLRVVGVRIVLNHLRNNRIESLRKRPFKRSLDRVSELGDGHESALLQLEKKERQKQLEECVRRLSRKERQVFKMGLIKGLSSDEIAADMNLSIQNVYTIKHRAIKKLKEMLSDR
jgi:RNA polymerase sigma-70 factor (ECF subfamily)